MYMCFSFKCQFRGIIPYNLGSNLEDRCPSILTAENSIADAFSSATTVV